MCSDSKDKDPEFQKFLQMDWQGGKVQDKIKLSYTFMPLVYHHSVWVPHKLVPMILDQCDQDAGKCIFEPYLQYCLAHQADILDKKDISGRDIIQSWTKQVADNFKLNQQDLLDVYDSSKDLHNSEMRTRYMYKYNTHHHVTGTPFAFVNGILLEQFPTLATDWMTMLQSVYDSQFHPKV